MKKIKESIAKKYDEEEVLIEEIIQFHYDNESEKENHKKDMLEKGYEDSGQVKENIGSVENPQFVFFGSYYKYLKNKIDEEKIVISLTPYEWECLSLKNEFFIEQARDINYDDEKFRNESKYSNPDGKRPNLYDISEFLKTKII